MEVSIFQAVLLSRTVEIPDKCPKCGVSFSTDERNLLEYRLEDSAVAVSTDPEIDSDDDINHDCESVYVTGYVCLCCKTAVHASNIIEAGVDWDSNAEPSMPSGKDG